MLFNFLGGYMLSEVLSERLSKALSKVPYSNLCELRLRADNPVVVNIVGENYYLNDNELSKDNSNAIVVNFSTLQSIMQKLVKRSLYSVNDQLINGYISYDGGIRVGVCGEVVSVDNQIKTIKNISSLNFRFPHLCKNCSLRIYNYLFSNEEVNNTLIISPPGAGKTTYLRDIIYQLSIRNNLLNILIIDERQELLNVFNGEDIVKLRNVDCYSNSTKKFALNNGIRSMKPDVIITDEINIEKDLEDIENAMTSGVKVIASIHASDIFDLKNKRDFKDVLNKKLFTRYIVLSKDDGVGTLRGVFNENLHLIGV